MLKEKKLTWSSSKNDDKEFLNIRDDIHNMMALAHNYIRGTQQQGMDQHKSYALNPQ